ncbi:hypothetical protein BEH_07405 [Priestia filamentosa]|uniref:Uncharacterized protein n=1 Tax=Priestia filamentosa TaxID=1402861 RepID=A0A0H4KGK8_9BACI|nr:hypothetical protein [Priestia filamentosa]AKO91941.1 hypothetical protein BEH_07405 [Priestia filamentosa]
MKVLSKLENTKMKAYIMILEVYPNLLPKIEYEVSEELEELLKQLEINEKATTLYNPLQKTIFLLAHNYTVDDLLWGIGSAIHEQLFNSKKVILPKGIKFPEAFAKSVDQTFFYQGGMSADASILKKMLEDKLKEK